MVVKKHRVVAYFRTARLTPRGLMNWQLFLSIYLIIFFAELPDKTAFATLLLATRSNGLAVFIGVSLAFLVQTVMATVFGHIISFFPTKWVHLFASLVFFYFALTMWRDRNKIEYENNTALGVTGEFWQASWKSFLVIFIAEWGDLTQVATATLIAKYQNDKLTVFVAAVLALWSVTLIAIFIGQKVKHILDPRKIRIAGAVVFLAIAIYFILSIVLNKEF